MRAAVDVMGGDKAPAAILQGCWEAAPLLAEDDDAGFMSKVALLLKPPPKPKKKDSE